MTITQLIKYLENVRDNRGEVPIIGHVKAGYYCSAMGGGELIQRGQSQFHEYVVALFTDSTLERD